VSEQTKQALDEVLAAHVAEEMVGAVVNGYVLMASTQTFEQFDREATGYFTEFAERQPAHSAIGLATMLLNDLTFPDKEEP